MISGIYKIENLVTKAVYIGSSINFKQRKKEHFCDLKFNKHHSKYMQRSYNKHGINNFKFEILAKCPKEYLIKLEQWFIDNLKPEYNMSKIAGRPNIVSKTIEQRLAISNMHKGNKYNLGRKASQETKDKMSFIRKGKILGENAKRLLRLSRIKAIIQYTLNNEFVKEWDSATDVTKELGLGSQNISRVCLNKQMSAYGYIWKFKTNY